MYSLARSPIDISTSRKTPDGRASCALSYLPGPVSGNEAIPLQAGCHERLSSRWRRSNQPQNTRASVLSESKKGLKACISVVPCMYWLKSSRKPVWYSMQEIYLEKTSNNSWSGPVQCAATQLLAIAPICATVPPGPCPRCSPPSHTSLSPIHLPPPKPTRFKRHQRCPDMINTSSPRLLFSNPQTTP